jgi:predicted transcriptional regulator
VTSLDPNELEIMKVLWEAGTLKPAEIQERLSRPVKNSALRWQLAALMQRGFVTRRKVGKAYFYRATTPRQRVFKSLIRRMADVFTGGSAVALIGQLLESEKWSEEDIRELRRIAAQKAASDKPSRSSAEQEPRPQGEEP